MDFRERGHKELQMVADRDSEARSEKKRVFIGSSKEGLPTAEHVQQGIARDARTTLWTQLPRLAARGKSPAAFERRCIPPGRRCSSVDNTQLAPSSRLASRVQRRSRCHAGFHHGLLEDHPNVGDVRGRGLRLGIELVAETAAKTPLEAPSVVSVVGRCARDVPATP